jgi:glycerol-3-phosphate acyltransferase PlsY
VFSGFRGGDGNAILGGIVIGLFPAYALATLLTGTVVGLASKKLHFSSLVHIAAGYTTLVALALATNGNLMLVLGFGGLACMVLAYASYGHMRRRRATNGDIWHDLEDTDSLP